MSIFSPDQANRLRARSSLNPPSPRPVTQPKLAVEEINDPHEREADRVADHVMRMPDSKLSIASAPLQLSRKCATCEDEDKDMLQTKRVEGGRPIGGAPPIVHDVLRSPGQPLDPSTRTFMESRFGHDFSQVRIHTDAQAADSAAAVRARAYTVGSHIVLSRGEHAPQTSSGLRLLAHELVHVTQQRAFHRQPIGSDRIEMGAPGDRFETEADTQTEAIVSGPVMPLVPVQARSLRLRLSGAWESCGEAADCPAREPGEQERAATPKFSVGNLLAPENGEIAFGFAIDSASASALQKDSTWLEFVAGIGSSTDRWEILGFSDCEGAVELNAGLRDKRAKAVLTLLPATAKAMIDRAEGAPLSDCIADNDSESNRTFNRARASYCWGCAVHKGSLRPWWKLIVGKHRSTSCERYCAVLAR